MSVKYVTYYYSDANGYFEGEAKTILDKKGNPMIPYYATVNKPAFKEGYWDVLDFNTKLWNQVKKPTTAQEFVDNHITCIANDPNLHNQEVKTIMESLVQADKENYKTSIDSDMKMSVEVIPPKTEEEITAEKAQEMRQKRDAELVATDVYLISDYPISAEDLELIKAYRQTLRDLPQQEGFPYVDFPVNPLNKE